MGYTLFQSGFNSFKSNYGYARKFDAQGTWNLFWCGRWWCDCLSGNGWGSSCEKCKMWKNSTFSNPINHNSNMQYGNDWWCKCHLSNGAKCGMPNFGEMESLTCQLKPLESF